MMPKKAPPKAHPSRKAAWIYELIAFDLLQEIDRKDGSNDAEIHGTLQHGGDPRAPLLRPRLGKQRGTDRPFTTDPQRRQETEDHQLPPVLREE